MSWAGSHRDFETVSLFFDSSPLEAASHMILSCHSLSLSPGVFKQRMGPKWAHWENLQSPLLPRRRKPKRRWVFQPFYPPFNEKSSIPGECAGKELQHTGLMGYACVRWPFVLALNIYQSQAQARQRTVCVCVCVCWGCRERAAYTSDTHKFT